MISGIMQKLKPPTVEGSVGPQVLASNPILAYYNVGKQTCSAGPDLEWKIFDATVKSSGKDASVIVLDKRSHERMHRLKKKDAVVEMFKRMVKHLEVYKHPKLMLMVYHSIEECNDTLAFATEPIYASLANIMEYHAYKDSITAPDGNLHKGQAIPPPPPFARDYTFIDYEIKYGLRQMAEAMDFLSTKVYHRNFSPNNILITKYGNWKISGLEFILPVDKSSERVSCLPFNPNASTMTQPNLDYMAPEIQKSKYLGTFSDIFSMGLVICSMFNKGRPLIQAHNNPETYRKQLETLEDSLQTVIPRMPLTIQNMVTKMLSPNIHERPSAKMVMNMPYLSDSTIPVLQDLDISHLMDQTSKSIYYRCSLKDALPFMPRKVWYHHVWPLLRNEMLIPDALSSVLVPVMCIIQESTLEDYRKLLWPDISSKLLRTHRSIQASVIILENLHVMLEKTPHNDEETKQEVLNVLIKAFESNSIQIQTAALDTVIKVAHYMTNKTIQEVILPKLKVVFQDNQSSYRIMGGILACIEAVLHRFEQKHITGEVLPLIWEFKMYDAFMIVRIVRIYRAMMSDKSYGLTVHLIATHVMPSLLPHTVSPVLNLEIFTSLLDLLQDMLLIIDKNQRNKLRLDCLNYSPDRWRGSRHMSSTDMHVPAFNIPNLRVEQRKTSSAENMARRKSSTGSAACWTETHPPGHRMSITSSVSRRISNVSNASAASAASGAMPIPHGSNIGKAGIVGSVGASPTARQRIAEHNLLRVMNALPNRRLSDNTLMAPKIKVAPSCVSSPGGTPRGSTTGLPIRRHSSIGPQERRGSVLTSSPPVGLNRHSNTTTRNTSTLSVPGAGLSRNRIGGSVPNTSSGTGNVLWPPNMNRSPRRLSSAFQPTISISAAASAASSAAASACSSAVQSATGSITGSQVGSSGILHQLSVGMKNLFNEPPSGSRKS